MKYTIDFVLSLKDKYTENKSEEYNLLNNFIILYNNINKIQFKNYTLKNKNHIKSHNTERNKYINKNININRGKNYKKQKNKFHDNSEWRNNIDELSKSENAWCSHSRNKNINDNNVENLLFIYKKIIISNLNKTTNKNIDKIIEIMTKKLLEYNDITILHILAEELLKKIWFDNSYYSQYVKIYNHFCNIKDWQENLFLIYNDTSGQYFWKYNKYNDQNEETKSIIFGPFSDSIEANLDALKKSSFKYIFLNHCQKEFKNRNTYIEKINYYYNLQSEQRELLEKNENIDVDVEIHKLKRKIFGTTEIIGYLLKHKKINSDIIKIIYTDIICDLLNNNINNIFNFLLNEITEETNIIIYNNDTNDEKRKKSLLLQCLFDLWYIIDKKFNNKSIRKHTNIFNNDISREFIYLIMYITEKNTWKTKTKFIIEDFYEFINNRYKRLKIYKIKSIIQNKIKKYKNIKNNNQNDKHINEYIFDEDNFNSFRSTIDKNISSYFNKKNYKSFTDNLDNIIPGDISTIGEDIYNKYMDELVFTAFVRCFEYSNEQDCLIDGLISGLLTDKFITNKNIDNTYKLIDEYWNDFIIDFPLMKTHLDNIKKKLS